MAKKNPSGAQRKRYAATTEAMKNSPVFSGLVRKRGGPKGVTIQRQRLQEQLRKELAWLGMPHKTDLALAKLLSTPSLRQKYRLEEITPHGAKTYEGIKSRKFRREISLAQRHVWGGPKIRKVPLAIKVRLNNFGQ